MTRIYTCSQIEILRYHFMLSYLFRLDLIDLFFRLVISLLFLRCSSYLTVFLFLFFLNFYLLKHSVGFVLRTLTKTIIS